MFVVFKYQSLGPGAAVGPCQASSGAWPWPLFLQLLCKLCSCKDATQPQSEMCHNNREPPQFICQWIKGPLTCPNLTSREDGTAVFLGFQKEGNKIWWKDSIISTTANTIPSLFPLMKSNSWEIRAHPRWENLLWVYERPLNGTAVNGESWFDSAFPERVWTLSLFFWVSSTFVPRFLHRSSFETFLSQCWSNAGVGASGSKASRGPQDFSFKHKSGRMCHWPFPLLHSPSPPRPILWLLSKSLFGSVYFLLFFAKLLVPSPLNHQEQVQ